MSNVREMYVELGGACPTVESQAQYLEWLARQVRTGAIEMTRAVVVMEPSTGDILLYPFGSETDSLKLVGLLEFAKMRTMLDFHGLG